MPPAEYAKTDLKGEYEQYMGKAAAELSAAEQTVTPGTVPQFSGVMLSEQADSGSIPETQ